MYAKCIRPGNIKSSGRSESRDNQPKHIRDKCIVWSCLIFDISVFSSTWFVLAFNVEACDRAVAIKTHSPTQCNGPVLNFSDLHLWGIRWLYRKKQWPPLCYFSVNEIQRCRLGRTEWKTGIVCNRGELKNFVRAFIFSFSSSIWGRWRYTYQITIKSQTQDGSMLALVHVSAQCCLLKVFLFLTFHTELKQSIHIVHLQTIIPED